MFQQIASRIKKVKVKIKYYRYKFKIWREGGQTAFVLKRTSIYHMNQNVAKNLKLAKACEYSVVNKGWCSLPCLFCKIKDTGGKNDSSNR